MSKIDDFKEYARRRIVERLREDKDKKAENDSSAAEIHAYDGDDSFYEGSDEEYKEFLDGLDVEITEDAAPVENTQKLNLGETINVKDVIEKVKEKASGIAGAAAARVSEAAEKTGEAVSKFRVRDDDDETRFEKVSDDISADIDSMKTALTDSMNDSIQKIDTLDERLGDVSEFFGDTSKSISELTDAASKLEKRIQQLEIQSSESADEHLSNIADLKHEISTLKEIAEQVRESVGGVSKLNDSVFDMKNSQQNTKTALSELQTAFNRLKKKTVMGIVIISIIGFITIALEVINLLA